MIRERNILPNNVEFQLIPYDDHCESAYGSLGVLDGYTECVNVYIGPICDYVLGKNSFTHLLKTIYYVFINQLCTYYVVQFV